MGRIATGSELMVVVKADAYGHGAVPVARLARECGVGWLGVALTSEALAMRQSADEGRILASLWAPGDPGIEACVAHGVDLSVSSPWALTDVEEAARSAQTTARIHLKIDTGLSRNGCAPQDWASLVQNVRSARDRGHVEVEAIWTHLANADIADDPEVVQQLTAFDEAVDMAAGLGLTVPHTHVANSAAAIAYPAARTSIVRTGIAVYGLSPGESTRAGASLFTPAMTMTARLALVKQIPAGAGVSYGLTWRADESSVVGLVPVGYADGIPRAASSRGRVLVDGRLAPVIGRVAMDQFVVDLSGHDLSGHDSGIRAGAEVIIFGPGTAGEWTADDWAEASGTIGYEIVTRIGVRVPRRYRGVPWA
jgi:alanine racemase